jgi:hypothetical protein
MADDQVIQLPELRIVRVHLEVEGLSPLICNRWSDKAKKAMLDKQQKKAGTGKEAKDPEADYQASLYHTDDGTYGFPAVGFKASFVRGGSYLGHKMTFLRGAFHVVGELVPLKGDPTMREDMVRISQTADIRYRGQFWPWSAVVPVDLNTSALSLEQLTGLARMAGFSTGVGEWRPERDGQYGRFTVVGIEVVA